MLESELEEKKDEKETKWYNKIWLNSGSSLNSSEAGSAKYEAIDIYIF